MATEPVEWRLDAANLPFVRTVMYAWYGLCGGIVALVLGWMGWYASRSLPVGAANDAELVAHAVVLLSAGSITAATLYYLFRGDASRTDGWRSMLQGGSVGGRDERTTERHRAAFSLRGLAVASTSSAALVAGLYALDEWLLVGYLVLVCLLLLLAAAVTGWGRLDPAEPTMEYASNTVPIADVASVRRVRLGSVVLAWIRYSADARSVETPSLLALTPEAAGAFDRTVAARAEPDEPAPRSSERAVTAALVGLGILLVAIGAIGWSLADLRPLLGFATFGTVALWGLLLAWIGYAFS